MSTLRNIAFLFGVGTFKPNERGGAVDTIEFAVSNVEELSRLFRDDYVFGAEIVAPANPTKNDMVKALAKVEASRDRFDTVLLYLCTHGKLVDGDYRAYGSEVEKDYEDRMSFDFSEIREPFTQILARNRVIILDTCYSGKAHTLSDGSFDSDLQIVTEDNIGAIRQAAVQGSDRSAEHGGFVLTSSSSRETSEALGDFGPHTAFTGALIETLREGDVRNDSKLTWDFVFEQTKDRLLPNYPKPQCKALGPLGSVPFFGNLAAQNAPEVQDRTGQNQKNAFNRFEPNADTLQCIVIESASETTLAKNTPLSVHAGSALAAYGDVIEVTAGRPVDKQITINAIDQILGSRKAYENTLLALAQAEIALFDVTNYEPGVMLLLGIRAVARRGITIASIGGKYVVGEALDNPFNIREVNLLAHSQEQAETQQAPTDLIGEKLVAGFEHLSSGLPYLDLPVFDAIRALPPKEEDREPKSHDEQALMLCSFSPCYSRVNWRQTLKSHLRAQLPKPAGEGRPELVRTLDMKSPRLVSQSLYEAIRLTQMCVADWTELRPNVFFEVGVRLAAVSIDPVHIVSDGWSEILSLLADDNVDKDTIAAAIQKIEADNNISSDEAWLNDQADRLAVSRRQICDLTQMFGLLTYPEKLGKDDTQRMKAIVERHEAIREKALTTKDHQLPLSFTYDALAEYVDSDFENDTADVLAELLRSVDLLMQRGTSVERQPTLYPSNRSLQRSARQALRERALAAWYYITGRYSGQLATKPDLLRRTIHLGDLLSDQLQRGERELAKDIRDRVRELRKIS